MTRIGGRIPQKRRLIYSVPAGHGKSRIIAAFIIAFSKHKVAKNKAKVVYSHEKLKKSEQDDLKKIAVLCNFEIEVLVCPSSLKLDKDTIYILDEVDYLLIDKQLALVDDCDPIILGLTATTTSCMDTMEKLFLTTRYKFEIIDSGIYSDPNIDKTQPIQLQNFFDDRELDSYARLVYIEDGEQLQQAQKFAKDNHLSKVSVNEEDLTITRTLEPKQVLFVT